MFPGMCRSQDSFRTFKEFDWSSIQSNLCRINPNLTKLLGKIGGKLSFNCHKPLMLKNKIFLENKSSIVY